jgi:hypothetical protein
MLRSSDPAIAEPLSAVAFRCGRLQLSQLGAPFVFLINGHIEDGFKKDVDWLARPSLCRAICVQNRRGAVAL